MDLSTNYMGLKLKNPLIVSSSELTNSVEKVKKCEEADVGAVVLKSLFEEQILVDKDRLMTQDDMYFWYPEAIDYLNEFSREDGVDAYLNLIAAAKKETSIPVIASINCITPREWPVFASEIEKSGADGLELNVSISPADMNYPPSRIEDTYFDIIKEVKKNTGLPIAVKIGFHFTNPARFIHKLSNAGIGAIILFNRFFRPDIDIDNVAVVARNRYSSPEEITIPLRWVALMSAKAGCNIAASTGIHDFTGMARQILAGATTVQVCSTLYKNGISYAGTMLREFEAWMNRQGYNSLDDCRGIAVKDEQSSAAFERVQFMKKTIGKID